MLIGADTILALEGIIAHYISETGLRRFDVYVILNDDGINAVSWVVSNNLWDDEERVGGHRTSPSPFRWRPGERYEQIEWLGPRRPTIRKPAIPSSESFPHGGGRLGRSAQVAEQIGYYPAGKPQPSASSEKPLYPDMRPGESKADYWKRQGS